MVLIGVMSGGNGYVILDNDGRWEIDKNYRDKGMAEGWLFETGYYVDYHNRFILTYSLIPP